MGIRDLIATAKGAIDTANGPLALLMDGDKLKELGANVANALPPSEVMLGALSRVFVDAISQEQTRRGPSDAFITAMRATERFTDDEEIRRLWSYIWSTL